MDGLDCVEVGSKRKPFGLKGPTPFGFRLPTHPHLEVGTGGAGPGVRELMRVLSVARVVKVEC